MAPCVFLSSITRSNRLFEDGVNKFAFDYAAVFRLFRRRGGRSQNLGPGMLLGHTFVRLVLHRHTCFFHISSITHIHVPSCMYTKYASGPFSNSDSWQVESFGSTVEVSAKNINPRV